MKRDLREAIGILTELNAELTPNNFFTKLTLSILHHAIKLIVYF